MITVDIWYCLPSLSSIIVMLAITGFNKTAWSVDIRTRLKYSNISSGTASLRMGTITVWVVEEGLNVRSSDILEKSIPAGLKDKKKKTQDGYEIPEEVQET